MIKQPGRERLILSWDGSARFWLLENSFCCCSQNYFINGVILDVSPAEPRIFMRSLLSLWSTSMLVLCNSALISFSSLSSCAQRSLCHCKVNFNLSGSVFHKVLLCMQALIVCFSWPFLPFQTIIASRIMC